MPDHSPRQPHTPQLRQQGCASDPIMLYHDHMDYYRQAIASAPALVDDLTTGSYSLVQVAPDGIHILEDMGRRRVVATATVPRPVHALLASLPTHSSHDFRRQMFNYFDQSFLDGARLPSGHDDDMFGPPVSLLWLALHHVIPYDMAFASTTLAVCGCRDGRYKVVPATDATTLGVQLWWSMPHLMAHTSHERLNVVLSGFVVEAKDELTSTVSFVLQFAPEEASGSGPPSDWLHALTRATVASFRDTIAPILPKALWTGNAYCYLCFRAFRLWCRRHHCRFCGHAICNKCATHLPRHHPATMTHGHSSHGRHPAKHVRACIKCPDAMMQRTVQLLVGGKALDTTGRGSWVDSSSITSWSSATLPTNTSSSSFTLGSAPCVIASSPHVYQPSCHALTIVHSTQPRAA
ncbi:Aste57867_24197 [Aphanomyces stellatus]|uniref:Aste57867_24197 protein n=1 Tax=Aphanomyces stellatus TaxID=120398 RepID=A0A485LPT2_9STRA|nr:hypothetical protein As57867_024123 [Aphanomyces stellatus]VFU00839.1 Aste57867_24197 [Aphanomyces stellatus]